MDLWTQLRRSGQEAAGKAKDLAEVTRLQLAQREQEARLEKLYAQLGRAFYETVPQEEGSEFFDLTSAITQLIGEIAASKEQQALLRGGTRCAACGAMMEADAAFCPACGTRREEPESAAETEEGKVRCPGCGRQVEAKTFCAFCGTKLS